MSNRRKLIIALGAGTLAAYGASFAQLRQKLARVVRLTPLSAATDAGSHRAFLSGMRDLGWVEGKNLEIEYRTANGRVDRLPALAAELLQKNVDVIVVGSSPGALAVKRATSTVPVVFVTTGDPVENGLIKSLQSPGGNVTGVTALAQILGAKRMSLFKETVPGVSLVAVLDNPDSPDSKPSVASVQAAARLLGLKLQILEARDPAAIESAFESIKKFKVQGLMVVQDAMFLTHQKRIVELAARYRLPTMDGMQNFVEAGGLMFYGVDLPDMHRRTASYVDKILKGRKPADLPVEQPTKFDLVINMNTAKSLGIKIPGSILIQATKLIE